MKPLSCETIQLSVAAERDGERAPLDRDQIDTHLATCAECRDALDAEAVVRGALGNLRRSVPTAPSIWPAVATELESSSARNGRITAWLAASGLVLVLLRVGMLGMDLAPGWWARGLPVLLVVLAFAVLGVNPFRVAPAENPAEVRSRQRA